MTSKEWYELFMAKVNNLMKIKNITAADIAERIGANQRTVERWINGERIPSAIGIVRIAKALDVEVKSLIDFED